VEFKLQFVNRDYNGGAIEKSAELVGLDFIDEARRLLHLPQLSIDIFDDVVPCFIENPIIYLTEDQARESGLYRNTTFVSVAVSRGELNKFTYLDIDVKRKENNEVIAVTKKYGYGNEDLYYWWKSQGFLLDTRKRKYEEDN